MVTEHQKKQLKHLRSGEKNAYEEASIYTILLDLAEGNGIEDVFIMLHNVACDTGCRKDLENQFERAKKMDW